MFSFASLFCLSIEQPSNAKLQAHLKRLNIESTTPLPCNYHLLQQTSSANTDTNANTKQPLRTILNKQLFIELVHSLKSSESLAKAFKIMTIILKTLRESSYQYINQLIDIEIPSFLKPNQKNHNQKNQNQSPQAKKDNLWAYQIFLSLKSYLLRLPSIVDILKVTLLEDNYTIPTQNNICLDHLYRLLNVFGLLFPYLNNGINVVGRYYMKIHPFITQFYSVLKEEILLAYHYIEKIVKRFTSNFQNFEIQILKSFMVITPEIQLFCDKSEEYILNKYFKGKPLRNKIYFREDTIQEITYYIRQKNEDQISRKAKWKMLQQSKMF